MSSLALSETVSGNGPSYMNVHKPQRHLVLDMPEWQGKSVKLTWGYGEGFMQVAGLHEETRIHFS